MERTIQLSELVWSSYGENGCISISRYRNCSFRRLLCRRYRTVDFDFRQLGFSFCRTQNVCIPQIHPHFSCCRSLNVVFVSLEMLTYLNSGAGLSTSGLFHYPASITNSSIATEFVQFAPSDGFSTVSTAGVINDFGGRQQVSSTRVL